MSALTGEVWTTPANIPVPQDTNIPRQFFDRVERAPSAIAAERRRGDGSWRRVTAAQMGDDVIEVARGMHALGVRRGKSVAILAPTSYEWAVLDLATLALGALTVPIYESDSAIQIKHILSDASVHLVVTETLQQAELIRSVRAKSVKSVLALERDAMRQLRQTGDPGDTALVQEEIAKTTLDDTATIIYTSGTTGMPKGVVLTHGNFVAPLLQAYDILPMLIADPAARVLLFLPVAHVLARFVMHGILMGEGRIAFSPDTRRLLDDIDSFKPTAMLVVPRVLEKVYNSAAAKAGNGIKSRIFAWSAKQARRMSQATAYPTEGHPEGEAAPEGATPLLRITHTVADLLVLRRIRRILGPAMNTIICGGAPLSVDLADFFRGAGVNLLQGYGLSETTGPVTVELPGDNPPNSVGYLWPGNSAKLASGGELLLRGISVSPGYHKLKKQTAEAFAGGWFHTGDLAEIDPMGRVRIVGRKKELLVTAGGKNVSPEVLESQLETHPLISHVVAVGDARPYIGALVTLDPEMLPTWLKNKGLEPVGVHEAAFLPEVKASIARAIRKANLSLSRAESIRRYRIVDAEFTVENGYLTPSLKLKRHRVMKDFAGEVDLVYNLTDGELAGVGGSVAAAASDSAEVESKPSAG